MHANLLRHAAIVPGIAVAPVASAQSAAVPAQRPAPAEYADAVAAARRMIAGSMARPGIPGVSITVAHGDTIV